jgi:Zn-dependent M28 family amino/carboxypeptidase
MRVLFLILFYTIGITFTFAQYSFDTGTLMRNIKVLSSDSLEGRKTGTAGGEKARTYIINELKKFSIEPFVSNYTQAFSTTQTFGMVQKGDGANILAVIPGKKKETIVISAHYDHLGIYNNEIYNGADDNASGTVAILAIAQYFKKVAPEHRLIFAFFDAEERGLKGSFHFVETIDLKEENIVLNINLDMVSRSDKNELYVCGTFLYPELKELIKPIKTPEGITLLFGHDDPILKREDWTSQSDQFNFHRKKIPFLYFGVEDHADYHRATDDVEKIDPAFYEKSVETILQAVNALDKGLH